MNKDQDNRSPAYRYEAAIGPIQGCGRERYAEKKGIAERPGSNERSSFQEGRGLLRVSTKKRVDGDCYDRSIRIHPGTNRSDMSSSGYALVLKKGHVPAIRVCPCSSFIPATVPGARTAFNLSTH